MSAATRNEISDWFDRGVKEGQLYLIVVCDTYDHDDYPAYVGKDDDFWARHDHFNGKNMQRIMEVYDLQAPKQPQMDERRAFHMPERKP